MSLRRSHPRSQRATGASASPTDATKTENEGYSQWAKFEPIVMNNPRAEIGNRTINRPSRSYHARPVLESLNSIVRRVEVSMRRLILTTASVIALGSAGLTYAGEVGGNTADSPASSGMTGINAGTPNASSAPAGTSQPGYNHNQAATGNSQWGNAMSSTPGTSQPWHER